MNSLDRIANQSGFATWDLLLKKASRLKNGIKIIIPLYFRLQFSDKIFEDMKNSIDKLKIEVYDDSIVIKK